MRVIKGLVLVGFLGIITSSCFEEPELPVVPEILNIRQQFIVTPDEADADSLIITFDFKDGDGNIGFTNEEKFRSEPYHIYNHYLSDGTGELQRITSEFVFSDAPPLLVIPDGVTGKLVTYRTRFEPNYSFLPVFNPDSLDCLGYTSDQILVSEDNKEIIDASYSIIDTLYDNFNTEYYLLEDTVYFKHNINHNNIIVEFFVKEGTTFQKFDWRKEYCTTFDGRLPQLSGTVSPIEGTIRYAMPSIGFLTIFNIKTLKLRVTIIDRALNRSNSLETNEFTLVN